MDGQQLIALVIVAVAAVWLVRTQVLAPRRDGCGGCGGCSSASRPPSRQQGGSTPLVQIELELPASRRKASGGSIDEAR